MCSPRRSLQGWLVVAESKRLSVFSPPGIFQQCVELPHVGQLWGCGFDSMSEVCYVTDIRAGSPKIFTLAMRGGSFDDNLSEVRTAIRGRTSEDCQSESPD